MLGHDTWLRCHAGLVERGISTCQRRAVRWFFGIRDYVQLGRESYTAGPCERGYPCHHNDDPGDHRHSC